MFLRTVELLRDVVPQVSRMDLSRMGLAHQMELSHMELSHMALSRTVLSIVVWYPSKCTLALHLVEEQAPVQ
jgi:hypothetical protein